MKKASWMLLVVAALKKDANKAADQMKKEIDKL